MCSLSSKVEKLHPQVIFMGTCQKMGEELSDCQDAYEVNTKNMCFAIADGLGTSFLPAYFAQLITKAFCNQPIKPNQNEFDWDSWLIPLQEEWYQHACSIVGKANSRAFWLRESLQNNKPAASTFIGLCFTRTNNPSSHVFQLFALGDSCLFQIRKDNLVFTAPLSKSTDFSGFTKAFSSYNPQAENPVVSSGQAILQDLFVLATDAFSKWLFLQYEGFCSGNNPQNWLNTLEAITHFQDQTQFEKFITEAKQRIDLSLEDDDIGLIVLKLSTSLEVKERKIPTSCQHVFTSKQVIIPDLVEDSPTGHDAINSKRNQKEKEDQPELWVDILLIALVLIMLFIVFIAIYQLRFK